MNSSWGEVVGAFYCDSRSSIGTFCLAMHQQTVTRPIWSNFRFVLPSDKSGNFVSGIKAHPGVTAESFQPLTSHLCDFWERQSASHQTHRFHWHEAFFACHPILIKRMGGRNPSSVSNRAGGFGQANHPLLPWQEVIGEVKDAASCKNKSDFYGWTFKSVLNHFHFFLAPNHACESFKMKGWWF